ncbi:MAG: anti-anti-sigma factor [Cytophagia bacterium]|jgi:anti-anti-sigma factor|nr:anti-anti-sigma factor [Cytophagia bacterium]|tara:strand:+ start:903 stop:1247 length:345 start_codon:yes stop_codon:yes gene_type:complete
MSDSIKNVEEKDGVIIISTAGYFNNLAGEAVLEVFTQKMESGSTKFLVDMNDSKVVNSIGVSILIEIIEKLQVVNGVMAFTNLAGIVEKTFNIMGITKYCEVYDSVDSALEKLS